MEHPILMAIQRASFTPLGWFATTANDTGLPEGTRFVMLIGNAGPAMFRRFARERNPATSMMDDWTRDTVNALAESLDAKAIYPFDTPYPPFLTYARRAGAGHVSPLGLNLHPHYGLWHAYRAALLFPVVFDLAGQSAGPSPCESCAGKPCLQACPVRAFSGSNYDVEACAAHLRTPAGAACMEGGCLARRACPVGQQHIYEGPQIAFHMKAFLKARDAKA